MRVKAGYEHDPEFLDLFNSDRTCAFIVTIDPEQTYFPKITSRVTESGAMESKPLHLMSPDLSEEQASLYLKYLD